MKGSVVRKGRRWYVIIEDVDPESGDRKRNWHSGFATKREAEDERVKLLRRQQKGEYVPPSRLSLSGFLEDEWLPAIRLSLRPSTFSSYSATVGLHVVPNLGSLPLQRLTAGHLNRLYASLIKSGRADGRGGLSPTSVTYVHRILRRSLNDAVRWGYLARNPATNARPPSPMKSKGMKVWTAQEIAHFLHHVRHDRLFAAWRLACTTAMRRGEILGLRWESINADNRTVAVVQSLVSVNYKVLVSDPKTSRGHRTIAVDDVTLAALRERRKQQVADQIANAPVFDNPGNFVFTNEDGSHVHPDRFTKMFQKHLRSAGLPRIRLHDVRHSVATLALESGAHPKVISERLGHFSAAFTMDTYSHVGPNLQAQLADQIAGLVDSSVEVR